MEDWITRIVILVIFMFGALYFYGLSKNVARTEKRHKKDMTGKINPYTGNIMPDAIEEEEREYAKREAVQKEASAEKSSDETTNEKDTND